MKLRAAIVLILLVSPAAGCIETRQYQPAGHGTFLVVPWVGEWTLNEELALGQEEVTP